MRSEEAVRVASPDVMLQLSRLGPDARSRNVSQAASGCGGSSTVVPSDATL